MKSKQEYGSLQPELRRFVGRKLTSIADSISFHRWCGSLKKEECRSDWSYLPPELLPIIARKLTDITDYIHFRSICTSWRLAASPSDLQPQQPLLLLQHKPQAHLIYGTSQGWVMKLACTAYRPDSSLRGASLLNPVTGAQILLPILPKHIHLLLSKCPFVKIVICPRPASPRPRQLLVALLTFGNVSFCRHGDKAWTRVDCGWLLGDIVYYDNELYLADNCGRIGVLQVESAKIRRLTKLKPPDQWPSTTVFLLEAAGDLLLIKWFSEDFGMGKRMLAVFRLDRRSNGELNWVSIGKKSVSVYPSWSNCARKIPNSGGGGYQIYFAYPDAFFQPTSRCFHICFHVIPGAGIIEQHCYQLPKRFAPGKTDLTWIVPSLE